MNRKMIRLVFATLFLSGAAFAQDGAKKAENFEALKTEQLKHLDERIVKMQEHRTCVANATQGDAMKACRESMRAFRETERGHMKEFRQGRKEARAKKKAEKATQ